MAKADVIKFGGVVDESLPGASFRVRRTGAQVVPARTAGICGSGR